MKNGNGVILKRLSYRELKEKSYPKGEDNNKMCSGYFIDQTRKALLTNPSYDTDDRSVLNMVFYNGEIVARHMLMATRIKIDDKVIRAQTGGGLEVHDKEWDWGLFYYMIQS